MKRIVSLFSLVVLVILFLAPTQAKADVTMLDEVSFFTNAQQQQLEAEYTDTRFDYLIMSVEEMEMNTIEAEAERLFEEGQADVLLLLNADYEAQLQVGVGSDAEAAITDGLGSNALQNLLETTFLSSAMDDQMQEGVEQLITEVEERADLYFDGQTESASPGTANETNQSSLTGFDVMISLILVSVFVVAVVIFFKRRRKKKMEAVKQENIDRQNRILSRVLKPYNQTSDRLRLAKGETEKVLKDLSDQLFVILTQAKEREHAINRLEMKKWEPFMKAISPIEEASEEDEYQLEELIVQVERLFQEEMQITERIKQHNTVLDQTFEAFKDFQKYHDEVFPSLEGELVHLLQTGKKASQLERDFDFIGAAKVLDLSLEENTQFMKNLKILDGLFKESQQLQEEMSTRKEQLTAKMNREKLIGISQNIDSFFEDAAHTFEQVKASIKLGDVKKAKNTFNKTLDLLKDAQQYVQDLIKKRDDSQRIRNKVEVDLKKFSDLQSKYHAEMSRLQADFHDEHWSDIPELYQVIQREVAKIKDDLPRISHYLQDEVQRYTEAYDSATDMQERIGDLKRTYEDCFNRYESLQYKHKTLQSRANQLESDVLRLVDLMKREQLSIHLKDLDNLGERIRGELQDFRQTPIYLERIENSIEDLEQRFKELEKYVQHAIRQKRDVERDWQEKERAYSQAQQRYGRGLSTRSYDNQYQDIRSEVQGLIAHGNYDQARGKISQLSSITTNMRRDYEQQRQRERNRNQSTRNAASFVVGTHVGKSMSNRNQSRHSGFPTSSGSRGAGGGFGSRNSGSRGAGGSFGGSRGDSRGSRGAGGSFKKR